MLRNSLLSAILLVAGLLPAMRAVPQTPAPLRVGTYETRAITIAYASSSFNPVQEKMREYEKAKESGDKKRARELEAWGENHQEHLHYLGFSRFPVDELLAPLKDQIAELAKRQNIDLIAPFTDYQSEKVELVDLTQDLVQLYNPSQQTLARIASLRQHPPLPPEEVQHAH